MVGTEIGAIHSKRDVLIEKDYFENDGISWCKECDVPLLGQFCESCGSEGVYCASDLKPVFVEERRMFERFFGVKLPEAIFKSRNRIVAGGKTLLSFHTNLKNGKLTLNEPMRSVESKLKELPSWSQDEALERAIKCNRRVLRKKEKISIDFIKRVSKEHKNRFNVVSFGGGKDSVVTAMLVRKAIGRTPLLFGDTTLEFPETYQFVERFAEDNRFDLIKDGDDFYRSDQDFFELCGKLGPPSMRYRWCCHVFKEQPINMFYRNLDCDVLAFTGIRRAESLSRRRYSAVEQGRESVRQILAQPIIDWKDADVWLYSHYKRLGINELYKCGYARVGCWPCPNAGPYSWFLRKLTHPELWRRLRKVLVDYAWANKKTRTWVEDGMWRLRKPKQDRKVIRPTEMSKRDGCYVFTYMLPGIENLLERFKIVGDMKVERNNGMRIFSVASSTLIAQGMLQTRSAEITATCKKRDYPQSKNTLEKLFSRAINCIGCGACIGGCPKGAMHIDDGKLVIDQERCNKCLKCLTVTCVAEKFRLERSVVKADIYKISPCSEGLPMNHLTFLDPEVGRSFAKKLVKHGVFVEVHQNGEVICVHKDLPNPSLDRLFSQHLNEPTRS